MTNWTKTFYPSCCHQVWKGYCRTRKSLARSSGAGATGSQCKTENGFRYNVSCRTEAKDLRHDWKTTTICIRRSTTGHHLDPPTGERSRRICVHGWGFAALMPLSLFYQYLLVSWSHFHLFLRWPRRSDARDAGERFDAGLGSGACIRLCRRNNNNNITSLRFVENFLTCLFTRFLNFRDLCFFWNIFRFIIQFVTI